MSSKEKDSLPPKNGWRYQESLVLDTLKRLENNDKEFFRRLNKIDISSRGSIVDDNFAGHRPIIKNVLNINAIDDILINAIGQEFT